MPSNEPPSVKKPQPVVQILVGENHDEFFVHKELLCYYSPYFAAALHEGHFTEAEKQSITLEQFDIGVFGLFVGWLYTQEIKEEMDFVVLAKLWVLGDYLQIPKLQNCTIQTLHETQKRCNVIPINVASYVYKNTTAKSLLRKIFVEFCTWRLLKTSSSYKNYDLSKEMLLDAVMAFNNRCLKYNSNAEVNDLEDVKNYFVEVANKSSWQQGREYLPPRVVPLSIPLSANPPIILLGVPRLPETLNLISSVELTAMQSYAVLVNVSREGVVNKKALVTALKGNKIFTAAMDVCSQEPASPENGILLGLDVADLGLVVTPHIAWLQKESTPILTVV